MYVDAAPSLNASSRIPEYVDKGPSIEENLLEINKKIYILSQCLCKDKVVFQKLQEEMHEARAVGVEVLLMNLKGLNDEFDHKTSFFKRLVLRIINCIRSLFGFEKIQPPFKNIDLTEFKRCATQALELTESEKKFPLITLQCSSDVEKQLTEENISKLIHGLLDRIELAVGNNHYSLRYDPEHKRFVLSFTFEKAIKNKCYEATIKSHETHPPKELTLKYQYLQDHQGWCSAIGDRCYLDFNIQYEIPSGSEQISPLQFYISLNDEEA